MPTISKVLFRGAATTTLTTTLYTVPAATTTVVTEIVLVNNSAAAVAFTVTLDGSSDNIPIVPTVSVGAYDSTVIPLKQPMVAAKTIKGGASTATNTFIHIGGVEIS